MIPDWVKQYVGLPFLARGRDKAGVDCWGLVRLVQAEQYGVELPSYDNNYVDPFDSAEANEAIAIGTAQPEWRRVYDVLPGDVLVFQVAGVVCHVGLYIGDGRFLHVRVGTDSAVERLASQAWQHRLKGVYRHVK